MNSRILYHSQAYPENKLNDLNIPTFQYGCNSDNECNISDEILSEGSEFHELKVESPLSMNVHCSRFSNKNSKKLSKSTFFKSMGESNKRGEKMNTEILKNNKKSSFLGERKSSDSNSTITHHKIHRSSKIQDEIKGLLRLLVQENKKKFEIEKSKDLPLIDDNKIFITMKDIQIAEDV